MLPRFSHLVLLASITVLSACHRNPSVPAVTPVVESAGDIMVDLDPVTQGRRMKVTWVQSARSNSADPTAAGGELRLMGLDSADRKGIVPLCATIGSYFRPLITRDGQYVIYTDRSAAPQMFALAWGSATPEALGPGVAVTTWNEPGLSHQWIYALEEIDHGARDGLFGKRLVRFQMERPTEREIVWAQTPMDADGFQLSRDGRRASGLLPSPEACRLNFQESTWQKFAAATWPALAPDDSYLCWALDADTATLQCYQPNQPDAWSIRCDALIEIGVEQKIWHPRWSNHPELITFTGPYPLAPNQPAFQPAQGTKAEIFVARLNAAAADFVSVVQITHNDRGDAYPDVWLENAQGDTLTNFPQAPVDEAPPSNLPWPANPEGLQFSFATAVSKDFKGRLTGHQSARFGKDWELDISRGYFSADAATGGALAEACRASNTFTMEGIFWEAREHYQQPLSVRLAGLRLQNGDEALGLYRVDNSLVLRVRLGADVASAKVYPIKLANFRIEDDRPYHLVLTLDQESVRLYIDSSLLSETTLEAKGLGGWTAGTWELGDPQPLGDGPWRGSVDHVSCYARAMTGEEVGQNFNAVQPGMANRKQAERIKLKGKLEAITSLTTPIKESPYARILTSRTYRVEQVEAGIYQAQYIVVLHDAALNRNAVPNLPSKLGEMVTLQVEPAAQHPELGAAEILNKTQLIELPLYLEVTKPPRLTDG